MGYDPASIGKTTTGVYNPSLNVDDLHSIDRVNHFEYDALCELIFFAIPMDRRGLS